MKTGLLIFAIVSTVGAGFCEPADLQFGFDRSASIEWITGERIEIEWNEVLDSRCAVGATCVWEGEVTVSVDVIVDGVRTKDVRITLHGEEFARAVALVDGYRIQLASVGPYPDLDRATERSEYVANVVVSPVTDTELHEGLSALNTQWRLQAFGKLGEEVPTLSASQVSITFELSTMGSGSIRGSGGCNGFSGSVEAVANGAIAISNLGFTDMACGSPTGVMAQEDRFFAELPNVIGFTMASANTLIMPFKTDDEVGTMIFSQVAATAVTSTSWGQLKSRLHTR
jgi:heat shock protein HslJ